MKKKELIRKNVYLPKKLMKVFKRYLEIRYNQDLSTFMREEQEIIFDLERNNKFLIGERYIFSLSQKKREGLKLDEEKIIDSFIKVRKNRKLRLIFGEKKSRDYDVFAMMLNKEHDDIFKKRSKKLNFSGYDYLSYRIIKFLRFDLLTLKASPSDKKDALTYFKETRGRYANKDDVGFLSSETFYDEINLTSYEQILKLTEEITKKIDFIKSNPFLKKRDLIEMEIKLKKRDEEKKKVKDYFNILNKKEEESKK